MFHHVSSHISLMEQIGQWDSQHSRMPIHPAVAGIGPWDAGFRRGPTEPKAETFSFPSFGSWLAAVPELLQGTLGRCGVPLVETLPGASELTISFQELIMVSNIVCVCDSCCKLDTLDVQRNFVLFQPCKILCRSQNTSLLALRIKQITF